MQEQKGKENSFFYLLSVHCLIQTQKKICTVNLPDSKDPNSDSTDGDVSSICQVFLMTSHQKRALFVVFLFFTARSQKNAGAKTAS